jgi:hypothetical protein
MPEIGTSGSVGGGDGNVPTYPAARAARPLRGAVPWPAFGQRGGGKLRPYEDGEIALHFRISMPPSIR